jgi:uncharacterized membrane protein YraQ (UPF0718 family)
MPNFAQTFNLFSTIFISIILEAIPFLLLGTFLSSIIEVFISEKIFEKIIPANRFLALLLATVIGLVFPVCECAVIPVAARLIKKGVPAYFAVAFILAVPTINIPVMLSTYYAFTGLAHLFLLRIVCAFVIAYMIGFFISLIKNEKRRLRSVIAADDCRHNEDHVGEEHSDHLSVAATAAPREIENQFAPALPSAGGPPRRDVSEIVPTRASPAPAVNRKKLQGKIAAVLSHTVEEFFDNGKYLVLGAIIASLFQALVPRGMLVGIANSPLLSSALMGVVAYVLSICSQTDAFVARSFFGQFPAGAVVGFMVIGAMMDIKNTAMLSKVFRKRFILLLFALIFGLGLTAATIINLFAGGGK